MKDKTQIIDEVFRDAKVPLTTGWLSEAIELCDMCMTDYASQFQTDGWTDANLEWPKKDGAYLCRFNESMDIYEVAYWNKEREMWEFEGTFFNCNFYSHWKTIAPPR